MSLAPRLDLRQSQSLVMTPQMQQAVKLLALSNLELEAHIGEALEANPLLELGEVAREDGAAGDAVEPSEADSGSADGEAALDLHSREPEDWGGAAGSGSGSGAAPDDSMPIERAAAPGPTLAQHLLAQLGLAVRDPRLAALGEAIIGRLDDAGYLAFPLDEVAQDRGASLAEAEAALALVQSLDPAGVGARDLAECLALQAREADRYDPCMERLIANLDLVAAGDVARLKRLCEVDDEDFADMLAELRGYDPRPGTRFATDDAPGVTPDVLLDPAPGGGWSIRINEATLPRLVVNREYRLELEAGCRDDAARGWLQSQLTEAHWLIRALDQRQKTILKVAAQIAERQAGFFARGVAALRPLTLCEVADAIDVHESTVSRVTSNKYLACPRGTFALKFFFTSGVASADGEGASAEAVKARIAALIAAEDKVLSDDALARLLKDEGFGLARRTVMKYRKALGIGSSVERRRARKLRG